MRKYIIIWFILLLVVKCNYNKEEIKIDPLVNAYKINDILLYKIIIKDDLNYFLTKYKRNWSNKEKEKFIDIIYYGSKEYNINYKVVLSIISVESQYIINAKGRNKTSIDYGLAQINSRYIKQRYKYSEQFLKKYKISYDINNKFDIGLNIFSCFKYLKDISDCPDLLQFSDYVSAYNQGIKGCMISRNNYYEKVLKELMEI